MVKACKWLGQEYGEAGGMVITVVKRECENGEDRSIVRV